MADENLQDQAEKTEEPSQYRIDEFRKKGEVASSRELTSTLILVASILTLSISMVYLYETLGEFVEWIYSLDASKSFTEPVFKRIVEKIGTVALKCSGPVLLVSFCVAIGANLLQIGFIFSPEVLKFRPDRINPVKGLKRLFSMRSLVEALKGIFKFTFILSIVFLFIKDDIMTYTGFLHINFLQSFIMAKWILLKLSMAIVLGLFIVAMADFAYQKYTYRKKLMMTKEEAKREHKEREGNPEIKQRIKVIQREIAQRRMINEVPKADVVVTNPTHISVALKYDKETMISPEVIAKGADNVAMKIREVAKKHKVPLVENVMVARTLYKTVKIGNPIPRTLYKVVAEILAFVYRLKRKEKALS